MWQKLNIFLDDIGQFTIAHPSDGESEFYLSSKLASEGGERSHHQWPSPECWGGGHIAVARYGSVQPIRSQLGLMSANERAV